MATLHLMVGLPCSGKTTWARELEQQHSALRLTPDEWQTKLFGYDYDVQEPGHDERHGLIEAIMWSVAARVLVLGIDVILDFGFWARVEREDYRARASHLGASSEIHYLEVPEEELLKRLRSRNSHPSPDGMYIPEALFRTWLPIFQPPAPDELQRRE